MSSLMSHIASILTPQATGESTGAQVTIASILTPQATDESTGAQVKSIAGLDDSTSPRQCGDEPEPEVEDGKSGRLGGLVNQLEGLLVQLESSESADSQRLQIVEDEKRRAVDSLNEKISSMVEERIAHEQDHARLLECLAKHEQDNAQFRLENQQMLAQLSEKEALDRRHESLKQDFDLHKEKSHQQSTAFQEKLLQQSTAFQETSAHLQQLKQETQHLTKEKLAQFATLQGVENKYQILECEFVEHKKHAARRIETLETSVERLAHVEKHNAELQGVENKYQILECEFIEHKKHAARRVETLETSVERLVNVEKHNAELVNKVSSLNEQIIEMQATSTAQAVESATTVERLGEQYRDIFQLVQEKQKKLAKLAAQESVPFDTYVAAKRQCSALQEELETYKVRARGKAETLQATLEARESEKNMLSKELAKAQEQIAAMQSASSAQAVESASVLERLSKQYQDIFHIMQEKQNLLSGLTAQEVHLQEGVASDSLDCESAQRRHQELQREFESYKVSSNQMLNSLSTSLQTQAREYQENLHEEAQRLAAVEKERSELSKVVESLNKQLACAKEAHTTSMEENTALLKQLSTQEGAMQELLEEKENAAKKIATQDEIVQDRDVLQQRLATQEKIIKEYSERITAQEAIVQEQVPLEEFQALRAKYQALQQDFEALNAGALELQAANGNCIGNQSTQPGRAYIQTLEAHKEAVQHFVQAHKDAVGEEDQIPSSTLKGSARYTPGSNLTPVLESEYRPMRRRYSDLSGSSSAKQLCSSDLSASGSAKQLFSSPSFSRLTPSSPPSSLRGITGSYTAPVGYNPRGNRLSGSISLPLGRSS